MKILFVCLGNICRSPTAEAIFNHSCNKLKLPYFSDSAGTYGGHAGEPSDSRSIKHAQKRGYEMTHLARQFTPDDFLQFDMIIGMDESNVRNIKKHDTKNQFSDKIFLMTDFLKDKKPKGVPDPYTGGHDDFELVLDLLEASCEGLVEFIETSRNRTGG